MLSFDIFEPPNNCICASLLAYSCFLSNNLVFLLLIYSLLGIPISLSAGFINLHSGLFVVFVQNYNTNLLKDPAVPTTKECSCLKNPNCQLGEKCLLECLIYHAQVNRSDTN